MTPEEDRGIIELPDLRILDQDPGVPVWDRRRPRFLLSGKMMCSCCGSGYSKVSQDGFGCSAARNKALRSAATS